MIGATTAKKALVSNSIPRAINTRACGPWIRSMVKAPIGAMRVVNFVESTQVTGLKTRNTVEVPSSSKIVIATMATGSMACLKERVA